MTCDCFFLDLLQGSYSIFCCGYSRIGDKMGNNMGFVSHDETEWGGILGIMFSVVMDKFRDGEVFSPFFWVIAAVDTKISFQFLVQSFSLTISLGVISGRWGNSVIQSLASSFENLDRNCGPQSEITLSWRPNR
jgi:hypothetical protein